MKEITLHDIFAVEYTLKSGDFIESMYSNCFIRGYSHKIYLNIVEHLRDYFKINPCNDKKIMDELKKKGSIQITRQLNDISKALTYYLMYLVQAIKTIILN